MTKGARGRNGSRVDNAQPLTRPPAEVCGSVLPGRVRSDCMCMRNPPHLLSPGSVPSLLLVTNSGKVLGSLAEAT